MSLSKLINQFDPEKYSSTDEQTTTIEDDDQQVATMEDGDCMTDTQWVQLGITKLGYEQHLRDMANYWLTLSDFQIESIDDAIQVARGSCSPEMYTQLKNVETDPSIMMNDLENNLSGAMGQRMSDLGFFTGLNENDLDEQELEAYNEMKDGVTKMTQMASKSDPRMALFGSISQNMITPDMFMGFKDMFEGVELENDAGELDQDLLVDILCTNFEIEDKSTMKQFCKIFTQNDQLMDHQMD